MAKKRVYVTREIPDEGIKLLKKKGYQVDIWKEDKPITKKHLLKQVKNCDALLSLLTDKITEDIMDAGLPRLQVIANYAVGFDNVDVVAAKQRKLPVTNTPVDEVGESVAEHVVALIFALAHRVVESDYFTREGRYKGWGPKLLLGSDVKEKTLGIIGFGRIGQNVARRMYDGFGVNILYSDVKQNKEAEKKYHATYVSQSELLKKSDFVTLHVPLLDSTFHLISKKELKMMKKTAFIINTSRGPVIDELALTKALINKEIAGAGLDVFECEPLIDCNPKDVYELRKLPNTVLTPHTASATIEARQAMSKRAAENIIAVLSGKKPKDLVK